LHNAPSINTDILLTRRCNLRCTYCYEHDFKYDGDTSPEVIDAYIKFIRGLRNSDKFNKKGIDVSYWGGEPTLRTDYIKYITDELRTLDNIKFVTITNGSHLDELVEYVLSNKLKNFFIQVSYDFSPNQERNRLPIGSEPFDRYSKLLKNKVLNNIYLLAKNNLDFSIKSTIDAFGLANVHDVYMDFIKVQEQVKRLNPSVKLHMRTTVDTLNMPKNNEALQAILQRFDEGMSKIIAYQLKHPESRDNFNYLIPEKLSCSVGYNLIAVDTDGGLYPCHGAIFSPNIKLHRYKFDIFNPDYDNLFIDKIYPRGKDCDTCNTCYCCSCNVHSFDRSKKKLYYKRMTDFTASKVYCDIQRRISKHIYAKFALLKELK